MDLALLTHLFQALVPLVDSGSKGGGFFGTSSSRRNRNNSDSTTNSTCLLRTQNNQDNLMRSKAQQTARLHLQASAQLLPMHGVP